MKTNRVVKLLLFLVGFSLLIALIYRVGFPEIIRVISGAKPHLIFLGILVYLLVILTRSLKWFLLTRIIENKIKTNTASNCFLVKIKAKLPILKLIILSVIDNTS